MTGRKDKAPNETRPPEAKSGESKPKGRKITGRVPSKNEKPAQDSKTLGEVFWGVSNGHIDNDLDLTAKAKTKPKKHKATIADVIAVEITSVVKMPKSEAEFGKAFEALARKPEEVGQLQGSVDIGGTTPHSQKNVRYSKDAHVATPVNRGPTKEQLANGSYGPVKEAIKTDARQAIAEIKLRRISKRPGKPREKNKETGEGEKGRPPALSQEVHDEIIHSISKLGMAETRAARAAGFDSSIVSKWKTRGQKSFEAWDTLTPEQQTEETRYVNFFNALRDSEYTFERIHVGRVEEGSKTDWRASVKMLEFKFPLRYGKRMMHAGDPQNTTPIPVAAPADEMTDAEATARAQRILNAARASEKTKKKG